MPWEYLLRVTRFLGRLRRIKSDIGKENDPCRAHDAADPNSPKLPVFGGIKAHNSGFKIMKTHDDKGQHHHQFYNNITSLTLADSLIPNMSK